MEMNAQAIQTVTGTIEKSELGHTQCHEHLFLERGKSAEVSDVLCMEDYEKSKAELLLYKNAGGGTVVDAQPVMCGRMAECMQKASGETGVFLIGSTGFHKTIFYYDDSYIFNKSEDWITRLYVQELQSGMLASRQAGGGKTNAKAGLIKTAVDAGGICKDVVYQKLHHAAAQAHLMTGAPVMCHMEQGANAEEVVDFYLNRGVKAECLMIAHLDRTRYDIGFHKDILSTGVYLEYDTIKRERYHDKRTECTLIQKMIEAGYEKQILLSLDTTRARLKSYGAPFGLDYILVSFLPYLLEKGISRREVYTMTVENPANALCMIKKQNNR